MTNDASIDTPPTVHDVIIVGAGFAGIGAAIKMREAGLDFLVLEKAGEIGGVWRANTYPDCACDVPSSLYSYSFAPNPDWTRVFAEQSEILDYLKQTAQRFGVADSVLVNHELNHAVWNQQARHWEMQTSQGVFHSRFIVMACGPMHKPVVPKIPGLESFPGATFHSAEWDHNCELDGKRVAIVGSGASAVQIVPAIQPKVAKLSLFQRTPHWVLPKFDRKVSPDQRTRFKRFPATQKFVRALFYGQFEMLNGSFRYPRLMKRLQGLALSNIYRTVKDPELREKLTPSYVIGCKRILQSNRWYRALVEQNVEVVSGLEKIDGNCLVASDGSSRKVDAIVFATGFEIANPPIAERIIGTSGVPLAQRWNGSPSAYLGTMVEDCPNCFLMFGPNLAIASSAFIIIEAQIRYIVDALTKARTNGIEVLSVDPSKSAAYNERVQFALQKTVWNNGGCTSYFLDASGKNATGWPWTTYFMRRRLGTFRLGDYVVEKRAA
ncbi:MAG: cation diffusion facilitator CzcD-associated flavoprotein CzcO [Hyphomicrobiaceae bacterium]|jgi:cation diffusion facilitator CzcD-associated flavoprotein CzcO